MKTFQDLSQQRDRMLHETALWNAVKDHLSKFLDGDVEPTKLGIASKGTGGVVPQDLIMEVQLQIDGTLDQLAKEISEIETVEVAQHESTAEEKPESDPAKDGAGSSKKGKKPKSSGGPERPPEQS